MLCIIRSVMSIARSAKRFLGTIYEWSYIQKFLRNICFSGNGCWYGIQNRRLSVIRWEWFASSHATVIPMHLLREVWSLPNSCSRSVRRPGYAIRRNRRINEKSLVYLCRSADIRCGGMFSKSIRFPISIFLNLSNRQHSSSEYKSPVASFFSILRMEMRLGVSLSTTIWRYKMATSSKVSFSSSFSSLSQLSPSDLSLSESSTKAARSTDILKYSARWRISSAVLPPEQRLKDSCVRLSNSCHLLAFATKVEKKLQSSFSNQGAIE